MKPDINESIEEWFNKIIKTKDKGEQDEQER